MSLILTKQKISSKKSNGHEFTRNLTSRHFPSRQRASPSPRTAASNTALTEGAEKIGKVWLIPIDAEKPADGRYKKRGECVDKDSNM